MRLVRRRLVAVAIATLSVQPLLLALGAARMCWGVEHTHHGVAAPDCPMHHVPDRHPVTDDARTYAHHGHATAGAGAAERREVGQGRVECRCPDEVLAMYAGPGAITPALVSIFPSPRFVVLTRITILSVADLWFPPPFPPPRAAFSKLS